MNAQAESTPAETRIDRLSPDSLVATFSQSHLLRWFLLAFLIHAIVIGGFSIGNVRDLLDPEGAKARKEAAISAAKATPASGTPAQTGTAAEATAAATARPQAENSAVEKATTQVAKPGEIPSAPDDLGLSIEDTNPK